ncbi:alkylhydroperoxidase like protein, AhpD family [Novosphingobium nitrogenifigens DSM 19370]|uniref:Alkylhydroperoxidase like protein, AhpD family n=1 Tax=Novosphingobium nitrogenifigens DSM 19370 TaxID=983920 RepID=F1ZBH2_9SPHN|nr:carboxymuconolactone decarboxylase family protein [Novosphingobium nitrogenifigens]EGD58041.1 alkylhydroperoxidase like protein, AhpD family [Novosphingobium nitrogenifigens DSM 19370]
MPKPIEYEASTGEVRAVYDDIRATRKTDFINNFWKVIAHHPSTLSRIWDSLKRVMVRPSSIDPLTKEMIYIAVSVTNNCQYCIASHGAAARAKGLTDEQFGELLDIVGLANETNRLAIGWQVEVDEAFRQDA